MFTHPYIAKIVARERYERKLRDAYEWRLAQTLGKSQPSTPLRDAYEWRLAQTLGKSQPSTPLRDAYRGLCGLAGHCVDWARGWQPQRMIEQR